MSGHRGGIDLGGTKIQAAIVDEGGSPVGKARRETPRKGGPADVAAAMAEALRAAAADAELEVADLEGVGVGSPGVVDAEAGTVTAAKNLPGWDGAYPLADALRGELGVPVTVGNDVQVAAEAELRLGAGRRHPSFLGVFWGTGVGGAIFLDGRPWLGRGAAGELGHVVVKHDGAVCPCGRRGCMEAYAGRVSMERMARERHEAGEPTVLFDLMRKKGRDRLTSGIWARALRQQDALAAELIDQAIEAIAVAVASAINLLDIGAVVLGGGMGVRFGKTHGERLRAAMVPHLFRDDSPPQLVLAELGDLGGAIGASLLVGKGGEASLGATAGARP